MFYNSSGENHDKTLQVSQEFRQLHSFGHRKIEQADASQTRKSFIEKLQIETLVSDAEQMSPKVPLVFRRLCSRFNSFNSKPSGFLCKTRFKKLVRKMFLNMRKTISKKIRRPNLVKVLQLSYRLQFHYFPASSKFSTILELKSLLASFSCSKKMYNRFRNYERSPRICSNPKLRKRNLRLEKFFYFKRSPQKLR